MSPPPKTARATKGTDPDSIQVSLWGGSLKSRFKKKKKSANTPHLDTANQIRRSDCGQHRCLP